VIIYGINPVIEALRAGRVTALHIAEGGSARLRDVIGEAGARGVPVMRVERAVLDRETRGGAHQGVAAELGVREEPWTVPDLVRAADGPPLIVVLDGIEDPHNVGAILRAAEAAGAHGVVRQSRRSASLDGVAAKASAGALSHVRIATVVNVARAIEALKKAGVWVVGLDAGGPEPYDGVDLTVPTALVFGAEGTGLRRLVRERCDRLVSIPMRGRVASLNVSVAAGIALFEAVRQRRARGSRPGAAVPDGGARV
jgi:23S rRNA (guanosine2251-2'-O)-methyltransferase